MINADLRSVAAEWVKYLLVLMTPLYFARVAPPSSLFSSILYPSNMLQKSRCIRDMSMHLIAIIANLRSQLIIYEAHYFRQYGD